MIDIPTPEEAEWIKKEAIRIVQEVEEEMAADRRERDKELAALGIRRSSEIYTVVSQPSSSSLDQSK